MSKHVVSSLVVLVLALAFSSAVLAESPAAAQSDGAFLASLQAPEAPAAEASDLPALEGAVAPVPKANVCGYQCRPCGSKRKLCWTCLDGTSGCGGCATVCAI